MRQWAASHFCGGFPLSRCGPSMWISEDLGGGLKGAPFGAPCFDAAADEGSDATLVLSTCLPSVLEPTRAYPRGDWAGARWLVYTSSHPPSPLNVSVSADGHVWMAIAANHVT